MATYRAAKEELLRAFTEQYVRGTLEFHNYNISAASRASGMNRVWWYEKMREYNILTRKQKHQKVDEAIAEYLKQNQNPEEK